MQRGLQCPSQWRSVPIQAERLSTIYYYAEEWVWRWRPRPTWSRPVKPFGTINRTDRRPRLKVLPVQVKKLKITEDDNQISSSVTWVLLITESERWLSDLERAFAFTWGSPGNARETELEDRCRHGRYPILHRCVGSWILWEQRTC